jgi:hypothetical protein
VGAASCRDVIEAGSLSQCACELAQAEGCKSSLRKCSILIAESNCTCREAVWGATGGELAVCRMTNTIRPDEVTSLLGKGEVQTGIEACRGLAKTP